MSYSRRSVVAGLSAALLAVRRGSSHRRSTAQELKEIRIGFQKAGIFPAVKQRATREGVQGKGISVRWVEFQFGPPILEAINTGNVDFGYAGDAPPIFAQAARRQSRLYRRPSRRGGYNQGIVVPDEFADQDARRSQGQEGRLRQGIERA